MNPLPSLPPRLSTRPRKPYHRNPSYRLPPITLSPLSSNPTTSSTFRVTISPTTEPKIDIKEEDQDTMSDIKPGENELRRHSMATTGSSEWTHHTLSTDRIRHDNQPQQPGHSQNQNQNQGETLIGGDIKQGGHAFSPIDCELMNKKDKPPSSYVNYHSPFSTLMKNHPDSFRPTLQSLLPHRYILLYITIRNLLPRCELILLR